MVYDGFPWDIKGIAEIGFRRELDLICQTDVHRPGRELHSGRGYGPGPLGSDSRTMLNGPLPSATPHPHPMAG